jgi:hypothetical protein
VRAKYVSSPGRPCGPGELVVAAAIGRDELQKPFERFGGERLSIVDARHLRNESKRTVVVATFEMHRAGDERYDDRHVDAKTLEAHDRWLNPRGG